MSRVCQIRFKAEPTDKKLLFNNLIHATLAHFWLDYNSLFPMICSNLKVCIQLSNGIIANFTTLLFVLHLFLDQKKG